jgi:hypothetical protein
MMRRHEFAIERDPGGVQKAGEPDMVEASSSTCAGIIPPNWSA